jgi:hypothetical protein
MAFPAVATVVLAVVARAGERSPVVSPTEPSTWIFPSSPMVCLSRKDFKQQGRISPEISGLVM